MVKNPPTTQETSAEFLAWEDPPEEGMASHASSGRGKVGRCEAN